MLFETDVGLRLCSDLFQTPVNIFRHLRKTDLPTNHYKLSHKHHADSYTAQVLLLNRLK